MYRPTWVEIVGTENMTSSRSIRLLREFDRASIHYHETSPQNHNMQVLRNSGLFLVLHFNSNTFLNSLQNLLPMHQALTIDGFDGRVLDLVRWNDRYVVQVQGDISPKIFSCSETTSPVSCRSEQVRKSCVLLASTCHYKRQSQRVGYFFYFIY